MKTKKVKKTVSEVKAKKTIEAKDLTLVTGGGSVGGFAVSGRTPT